MSASNFPAPDPQQLALRLQQAIACHQQGQLAQAENGYRTVLGQQPDNFHALHLLGVLLHQGGQHEHALALIQAALAIDPGQADAYSNLGVVLQALRRYVEALDSFTAALRLRPDWATALNNRGNVLRALKRPEEALLDYAAAIHLKPDYAEAFNNRGNALKDVGRLEAALANFEHAAQLAPNYAEAWNNRGTALKLLQRYDEALLSFAHAYQLRPAYADAHWNESLCRLLLGDFAQGWRKHEWRWHAEGLALTRRSWAQPLWLGLGVCEVPGVEASHAHLEGKTILLHAEQGWGDTLQFCRYAQQVAALGAIVLLEVPAPLKKLLSGLAGVTQVYAQGEALPSFDFQCPLLSLPLALGCELATMPAPQAYLSADPFKIGAWSERLARLAPKRDLNSGLNPGSGWPLIGLAWSGNPHHVNDAQRSIPLAQWGPVLAAKAHFVSVQTEVRESDREAFARFGIIDVADHLHDFSDTAALLACLDRVIAVDTAGAHLAGALGRPSTVLLPHTPDFRWLLERDDSPWYPAMQLRRQTRPGHWDAMIDRVAAELSNEIG
jgi:tetratricopeptide (TPR) repeat protein